MHGCPRWLVAALMVALLASAAPVPTTTAQSIDGFKRCGDENLILIFKNPDLQPDSSGVIHATGFFFIQFQAIGDRAFDIEKFAFSFGKAYPSEAMEHCDLPADSPFGKHSTAAYIWKYRADDNPSDGFFVPINTTNVPDGDYAAAVSAFDAAGNEIVRYYANAVVENGCQMGGRDPSCTMERIVQNDKIKPWPIVLPGDGEQTHPAGGLTMEFAEPLQSPPDVWITPQGGIAQRVPIERLADSECRLYDDDAVPDNALYPSAVQERCWGPTYHWSGTIRNEDIIRVRAVDLAGNEMEKILHIGDPTIGGRIVLEYPEVEIVGAGVSKTANADGKARFPMEFRNVGEGSLHGNLLIESLPDGLTAKFDRDHAIAGPGKTHFANLTVTALANLTPGGYEIPMQVRYQSGGEDVSKPFKVTFVLEERTNRTDADEHVIKGSRPDDDLEEEPIQEAGNESEIESIPPEDKKLLPAPAAVAALAAVGAAAIAFAPRRRG